MGEMMTRATVRWPEENAKVIVKQNPVLASLRCTQCEVLLELA